MKANSQFDLHPDAESLNAFAEQALGEGERGQILEHLAGCSRCRQVVYLAQEAAAEMEPTVATRDVRAAIRHEAWFRNWWIVWAPAAALAAVGSVAVYVHLQQVRKDKEMAKVTLQAVPQATPQTVPPAAPQIGEGNSGTVTPAVDKKAAAEATGPARLATRERKTATASAESQEISASGAMGAAGEAGEANGVNGVNGASNRSGDEGALPGSASGAGYRALGAAAESNPLPAVEAWRREQQPAFAPTENRAMAARTMAQAKAVEQAKPEARAGMMQAAAPTPPMDATSAPPASFEANELHGTGGGFAAHKAMRAELPSGLPVAARAESMNHSLALDREGRVFLSEDAGGHWESVARQWTGRAVMVRVEAAGANAGAPGAVFEIVNDRGQVWVSTEGRIWKAK